MKILTSTLCFFLLLISTNLSASQLTLFIGDSHSVGTFGKTLDQKLRTIPEMNVKTYASCGSIGRWFWTGNRTHCGYYFRNVAGEITKGTKGPTPKINEIFEKEIPDYVIIQLSGNYTGYADSFILKDMEKLAKYVTGQGSKCLWAGAADSRNRDRIPRLYRLLYAAVSDYCKIVRSDDLTTYPETGGDGIHYSGPEGRREARRWATGVHESFLDMINVNETININ